MQPGARSQAIARDKISGATLMRTVNRDESEDNWDEQRAAQFLGPDAAQKIHELRDKVGEIMVACRDSGNPADETEIPAPLTDATFVQEFETRLGKRWLSESNDRQQATKLLFTLIRASLPQFSFCRRLLQSWPSSRRWLYSASPDPFLSIQKMLLDLQDGNYDRHRLFAAPRHSQQTRSRKGRLSSRRMTQHQPSPYRPASNVVFGFLRPLLRSSAFCINPLAIRPQKHASCSVAAP
jgi:hypothetical protein